MTATTHGSVHTKCGRPDFASLYASRSVAGAAASGRPLCSRQAIPITQRANAIVIFDHPLILPLHDGANVRRKVLLQRFFVLRLRVILTVLAFFEYRQVLAARQRLVQAEPATVESGR